MKLWFIFLLLSLVACSSESVRYIESPEASIHDSLVVPVYIDVHFSQMEQMEIKRALYEWNHSLNGYIRFDVESDRFDMSVRDIEQAYHAGGIIIEQIGQSSSLVPPPKKPGELTLAWAGSPAHRTIYVVKERVKIDDMYGIMLHEIGHSLGADHVGHYSLMYRSYTKQEYQCIDKATIDQLVRIYTLPLYHLNYCEY